MAEHDLTRTYLTEELRFVLLGHAISHLIALSQSLVGIVQSLSSKVEGFLPVQVVDVDMRQEPVGRIETGQVFLLELAVLQ